MFKFRTVMIAVGLIAIGIASLAFPLDFWRQLMYSAALFSITFAVAACFVTKGGNQAFWIGYAALGWVCYLQIMQVLPGGGSDIVPIPWLAELASVLFNTQSNDRQISKQAWEHYGHFVTVGRSLSVIGWGVVGGGLARWIFNRARVDN